MTMNNDSLFFQIWRNNYLKKIILNNILEISENQANSLKDRIKINDIRSIDIIVENKLWAILKDMLICDRSMYISSLSIEKLILNYPKLDEDDNQQEENKSIFELLINKKRERLQLFPLIDISILCDRFDLAKILINNGIPSSNYTMDLLYSKFKKNENEKEILNFISFFKISRNYSNENRNIIQLPIINKQVKECNNSTTSSIGEDLPQLIQNGKIRKAFELIEKEKLDLNKELNHKKYWALKDIVAYGSVEFIKKLVNYGLDGSNLLQFIGCANRSNNFEVVKYLLDNFENEYTNDNLCNNAVFSGDLEMVEWLFNNYKELLVNKDLPPETVVDYHCIEVDYHVKCYSKPFYVNRSINYLLKESMLKGEMQVFTFLLNKHPELITETIQNRKYLNIAIDKNLTNVVRYLYTRGELLNIPKATLNKKDLHHEMRSLLHEISNNTIIVDQKLKELYSNQKKQQSMTTTRPTRRSTATPLIQLPENDDDSDAKRNKRLRK